MFVNLHFDVKSVTPVLLFQQETHDVAAGQVCELGKDGRLQIRWADGTHSNNYPQELYLIGDEVRREAENWERFWYSAVLL